MTTMVTVHCKKCYKAISGDSFEERMAKLRRHYKKVHGGWKRPVTKDRRYKDSSSLTRKQVYDLIYEILSDEGLLK
mgnify:CR=1 FL=1